jgi:acyl-CoA thioester hydrolase
LKPFVPQLSIALRPVARVRVLYADTDKMGVVYHASYLRYLEMARVEFIRDAGYPYGAMESDGFALPVTDLAIRYRASALYDDVMTIEAGLAFLSRVRVHFHYRVTVRAGDRPPYAGGNVDADVEILTAQTRHCCLGLAEGRPAALPNEVYDLLRSCYTHEVSGREE